MATTQTNHRVIDLFQDAVQRAIDLQQSGLTATHAMTKVASDLSLSPEQINRVSQILNRSSMNCQRLHSDDLSSKLADVEIIDPQQVIAAVYKTVAAPKVASSPLETRLLATIESAELSKRATTVKVAEAPVEKVAEKDCSGYGLYHGLRGPALVETRNRWTSQRKEAELELNRIYAIAQQQLDALEAKMASLPQRDQVAVVDQGKFYFEETNPQARVVMLQLADGLDAETQAKIAMVPQAPEIWNPNLFERGLVAQVERLVKTIEALPAKTAELHTKMAEAEAHLELIDSSCVNGVVCRTGINLKGSFREKDEAWIQHKTAALADVMGGAMLAGGGARGVKPLAQGPTPEERFLLQIRNPQHEAALGAVRTRAALQELVSADPVIKSYKPNEVIAAFNELSQYSPRAVEHIAALRAGLRQVLVNNTSLFDLQQLRESERKPKL